MRGQRGRRGIVMSGDEVLRFFQIPTFSVKMMPPELPVEYVTPSHVSCDVAVGEIIETENFEPCGAAGFTLEELRHGTLVMAGTSIERYALCAKILSGLHDRGYRFIVVTSDAEYRRLHGLNSEVVVLRLGETFVLNPLDTEGAKREDYALHVANIFAAVLQMSPDAWRIFLKILYDAYEEDPTPTLLQLRERLSSLSGAEGPRVAYLISALEKELQVLTVPPLARMFCREQTIGIRELAERCVVIEVPKLSSKVLSLVEVIFMIKILASGLRENIVLLLDECHHLFSRGTRHESAVELLGYLDELRSRGHFVLLTTSSPGLVHPSLFAKIGNRISFKVGTRIEQRIVADVLNLREFAIGIHAPEGRRRLYQMSYLKNLEPYHAVVFRYGFSEPFLVRVDRSLAEIPAPTDEQILSRVTYLFPEVVVQSCSGHPPVPLLLMDFGADADSAAEVLNLIKEYPGLSLFNIATTLDLDVPYCARLIQKMEEEGYVHPTEQKIGKLVRRVYYLTEKGSRALHSYYEYKGKKSGGDGDV